ncbi:stage II sporulation protein M [Bacillus oleivorans]|uniref:Stage II sporulation protein M n=1 Tax=Bacillus oleivorans TaxID=1448271 RepID=A0A285CLY9_9BACI|nr:stage II sporulation protein M [Bacillus oleivorans]SNX68068.1 stage II sporulation protein M [Bacillus oleivorans]
MKIKKRFSRQMQQTTLAFHLKQHSSIYLFVTILFLMGIVFGSIVVNSLSFSQKEDLFYYLNQFFGTVIEGETSNGREMFFQSLFHNAKLILFIFILGVSIIGVPIILIILFMKGVVIGFTVGFLVYKLSWEGFFLSFVSVLPQNLITVPVLIMMAVMAITLSFKLVKRQFIQSHQPIAPLFSSYILTFVAALCLLVGAAATEAFVSPFFMERVVNTIF